MEKWEHTYTANTFNRPIIRLNFTRHRDEINLQWKRPTCYGGAYLLINEQTKSKGKSCILNSSRVCVVKSKGIWNALLLLAGHLKRVEVYQSRKKRKKKKRRKQAIDNKILYFFCGPARTQATKYEFHRANKWIEIATSSSISFFFFNFILWILWLSASSERAPSTQFLVIQWWSNICRLNLKTTFVQTDHRNGFRRFTTCDGTRLFSKCPYMCTREVRIGHDVACNMQMNLCESSTMHMHLHMLDEKGAERTNVRTNDWTMKRNSFIHTFYFILSSFHRRPQPNSLFLHFSFYFCNSKCNRPSPDMTHNIVWLIWNVVDSMTDEGKKPKVSSSRIESNRIFEQI